MDVFLLRPVWDATVCSVNQRARGKGDVRDGRLVLTSERSGDVAEAPRAAWPRSSALLPFRFLAAQCRRPAYVPLTRYIELVFFCSSRVLIGQRTVNRPTCQSAGRFVDRAD